VTEFRDVPKFIALFLQNPTSYGNFIPRFETTGLKSEMGHRYHSGCKISKKFSSSVAVWNENKDRFLKNVGLV